nr:hypothetical protein [Tanacetum cinerariifolium]
MGSVRVEIVRNLAGQPIRFAAIPDVSSFLPVVTYLSRNYASPPRGEREDPGFFEAGRMLDPGCIYPNHVFPPIHKIKNKNYGSKLLRLSPYASSLPLTLSLPLYMACDDSEVCVTTMIGSKLGSVRNSNGSNFNNHNDTKEKKNTSSDCYTTGCGMQRSNRSDLPSRVGMNPYRFPKADHSHGNRWFDNPTGHVGSRHAENQAYVSKMDAKENTARDPVGIWKLHDTQLLVRIRNWQGVLDTKGFHGSYIKLIIIVRCNETYLSIVSKKLLHDLKKKKSE